MVQVFPHYLSHFRTIRMLDRWKHRQTTFNKSRSVFCFQPACVAAGQQSTRIVGKLSFHCSAPSQFLKIQECGGDISSFSLNDVFVKPPRVWQQFSFLFFAAFFQRFLNVTTFIHFLIRMAIIYRRCVEIKLCDSVPVPSCLLAT